MMKKTILLLMATLLFIAENVSAYILYHTSVYRGGYEISCPGASDGWIRLDMGYAITAGFQPPFSFAWSNGDNTQSISNLPAGTYTVSIHDALSAEVLLDDGTGTFAPVPPITLVQPDDIDISF